MNRPTLALLVVSAAFCGGCIEPPPKTPPVALTQLVAEYNANAAPVTTLFAKANISINVRGEHPFSWSTPYGTLMLGKGPSPLGPGNFVLIGRESTIEVFRLGTNIEQNAYYLWGNFGDKGKAWIGQLNLAGAPGIKEIPIDPTQLISVLCVNELPQDLTKLPALGMTIQNVPGDYAYVVTYIDRQPISNRILFRREVYFRWSDTLPRQAYKVCLIDETGRRVMTAMLKNYKPIKMDEGYSGPASTMPSDIDIDWPGKARIHLMLSNMTIGRGDPAEASRLELPPAIHDVVRVDENVAP